jgi:hypothetical protein
MPGGQAAREKSHRAGTVHRCALSRVRSVCFSRRNSFPAVRVVLVSSNWPAPSAGPSNHNGRTMSRNNLLYLIVGGLVVVVAVLGYYQYQDHNKKQAGLSINLGPAGIHVDGGSK